MGDGFDFHGSALMTADNGQAMHHAHPVAGVGFLVGPGRVVAGVDNPFNVLFDDFRAVFHLGQTGAHLNDVDRVPAAGGKTPYQRRILVRHGKASTLGGMIGNIRHFFRLQRPEVHLHAAGTQRGRNFRWTAGSCTHQPEIGWQPVFENIVDITRNGSVLRTVIGRLQHDLPIFQHLEQLVHLNGMQFADLIQKQHAAMGLSHCAGFRLRNALHAQRSGPLIDRIMYTAD